MQTPTVTKSEEVFCVLIRVEQHFWLLFSQEAGDALLPFNSKSLKTRSPQLFVGKVRSVQNSDGVKLAQPLQRLYPLAQLVEILGAGIEKDKDDVHFLTPCLIRKISRLNCNIL